MKRKLINSLRLLLVAAGLCVGESAWADEITATLDHTAGAQWGSNSGASTVDAEKEHYNNDAESSWAGCAYAKFSATIPNGHSITKAILTYSVNQGGRSGRNDIIYYMAKEFDLDWANFAGQFGTDLRNTSNRAGKAVAAAATGGTGDRLNLTQDVTDAVRAIFNEGQNYIIFQWTGNAGGADLYGKASAYKPSLVITTSAETSYEVTFSETHDASITVKIDDTDVTSGTFLVNGTYNFTATAPGYMNYDGSFTVSGADQEVSFTMTLKPRYTFTVNAVNSDGGATLKTFYTDNESYDGKKHLVYFPAYLTGADNAVTYSKDNSTYYANYTSESSDATKTVSYTAYTGNALFFEGEDVTDAVVYTTSTFAGRSSNGAIGVLSEKTVTSLDAGSYKISARVIGKAGNTCSMYLTSTSGEKIFDVTTSTTGAMGVGYITLDATTPIVANGGYYTTSDNGFGFDYILIEKVTSVSKTITSVGWATYCSPFALDFTGDIANLTDAYIVTGGSAGVLTKTSVKGGTVPANTGLLLKGTEGTVTIPVVATGSTDVLANKLVGVTANTEIAAEAGYVLMNDATNGLAFYKNKNAFTVGANTAYLPVDFAGAAARFDSFSFDDETTGITQIENGESNIENSVYNLNGQRVSKPKNGLYIVNGKKVIVK